MRVIFEEYAELRTRQRIYEKRKKNLSETDQSPGRLWYGEPNAINNAIGYAIHRSRSHDAIIRLYDAAGNVVETHERVGIFKEW